MKKSFILHIDSLSILDEMTNEQKGLLFDAIYKFNIGKEVNLDFAMKMAFAPFKNQFDRDNQKYQAICDRNQENIEKRWKKDYTKNTSGINRIPDYTKNTYNDSDNNNESKNDSDNESDDFSSSPKISSFKDLDYNQTVELFNYQKKYFYSKYPTEINAKEQIVFYANNICTIRSDLIRVEQELLPYDTNQFLKALKDKTEDSFNLLYRELKIIKPYSSFEDSETALKTDLFHIMNGLLNEYKFKGFNELQHVFNSFKKRAARELKVKIKNASIKNYG